MPVETRYMRSDTQTVNGVTGYKLLTTQSASYVSKRLPSWTSGDYLYVNIYKVSQNGVSTFIKSGAFVYGPSTGLLSATISIPTTTLDYYDAVKVEVWHYYPDIGDTLTATFITEQLGASKLNSATWTVYYYIYKSGSTYYFRFGTSTYDSKITNFSWTAPVAGFRALQYVTEPPTAGWNKLKYAVEPPVAGAWNKLLYQGE